MRRQPGHLVSLEVHPTVGRWDLAGNQVEERRLPGAVGTDDRMQRTGFDLEAHAVDGTQPAEVAREAFGPQQRAVAHGPASVPATRTGTLSPGCRGTHGPPATSRNRVNASTRPPRRNS